MTTTLTDEQIRDLWDKHIVPVFGRNGINPIVFARAVLAAAHPSPAEPEYWQWRRKGERWGIDQIYRHEVYRTTDDSEVRKLYAHPSPAQPAPVPRDAALNTLAMLFHSGEEIEGDDGAAMMVEMALWHEASEALDSLIGEGDGETLASSAAPVPVPTGWKLVPVEPTPDMVGAAFDLFEMPHIDGYKSGNDVRIAIYRAMIAASPEVRHE